MSIHLHAVVGLLPERVVSNAAMVELLATRSPSEVSAEVREHYALRTPMIEPKTGIGERRMFPADRSLTDIALEVAEALMRGRDYAQIDAILLSSSSAQGFPGLSQRLVAVLRERHPELPAQPFVLDVSSNACTSFLYAVGLATALLRDPSYRQVLCIAVEAASRCISYDIRDFNTSVLFGDAAGGFLLARDPVGAIGSLSHVRMGSRIATEGIDLITGSGSFAGVGEVMAGQHWRIDGPAVARGATELLADELRAQLDAGAHFDWVVPHQANHRMILEPACERAGIDLERIVSTLEFAGNTSSASIPLALDHALRAGRITSGSRALLVAFGASFSVASMLLTLDEPRESTPRESTPGESAPPPSGAASAGAATQATTPEPIAIIGMAGRFPGAADLDTYWANLVAGRDCTSEVPADHWDIDAHYDPDPRAPNKTNCRRGGFLSGVFDFAPTFFHLAPREARYLDPQQRLFLEVAWQTLEDAGYAQGALAGSRTGVYVGVSLADHLQSLVAGGAELPSYVGTGNVFCIIANRVSYHFDLRGPSLALDTACSSSLVALHLAWQALQRGEIDQALVGGVNLSLMPTKYIYFAKAHMLATQGGCRSFDAAASGYVPGEGVGAVLLKPLAAAERDGDRISAIVRGVGVNQDGRTAGITAPSFEGQRDLCVEVYARSGIDPATIGYVEAHGTGTPIGDPTELRALREAFARFTARRQFCALGSVKPNIGHLEPAAGIASLIKVVLALRHRTLPPLAGFERPNPTIEFCDSPFYVPQHATPWLASGPRRAATSAFSFGGVNAHVVVEEPPLQQGSPSCLRRHVVALSAGSAAALEQLRVRVLAHVEANEGQALADLAYTSTQGRAHFDHRLAFVVGSREQLLAALRTPVQGSTSVTPSSAPRVDPQALLAELGDCDALVERLAALWLAGATIDWQRLYAGERRIKVAWPLYPFERQRLEVSERALRVGPRSSVQATQQAGHRLLARHERDAAGVHHFTAILQLEHEPFVRDHPVLGRYVVPSPYFFEMVRAAALELQRGQGSVEPRVAVLAEVMISSPLFLEPGVPVELRLSLAPHEGGARFRLSSSASGHDEVHCGGRVEFADERPAGAATSPDPCDYVEQTPAAIAAANAIGGPSLQTLVRQWERPDALLAEIRLPALVHASASDYELHPALLFGIILSVVSRLSLDADGRMGDPFLPMYVRALRLHGRVSGGARHRIVSRFVSRSDETAAVDVRIYDAQGVLLVQADEFVFKRVRSFSGPAPVPGPTPAPARLATREEQGELVHAIEWVVDDASAEQPLPSRVLVFDDGLLGPALAEALERRRVRCRLVRDTRGAARLDPSDLAIDFGEAADYERLLATLARRGEQPELILHLAGTRRLDPLTPDWLSESLRRGVASVLLLARALARTPGTVRGLWAVTSCASGVEATHVHPEQRAISGLLRTAALELRPLATRWLDVPQTTVGAACEALLAELATRSDAADVARIGARRWLRRIVPRPLVPSAEGLALVPGGVYWITGGLGALGLLVAEHLARRHRARLVLIARRGAGEHAEAITRLEQLGGEVLIAAADVADEAALRVVLARTLERFGRVDGVFHCAGVLADGLLRDKTVEQLRAVARPKIDAALALERVLAGQPLGAVVYFSSIAAALGNLGQTDYAAANEFLDGLAEQRRREGRPYVAIDWSLWASAGMGRELHETVRARGLEPLAVDECLAVLERVLASSEARVLVARFVAGATPTVAPQVASRTEAAPPAASERESLDAVERWVTELVADKTGLARDQIGRERRFLELGVDSIISVEIVRALETRLGTRLSATLLFDHFCVELVARHLLATQRDALQASFPLHGDPARAQSGDSQSGDSQSGDSPSHDSPSHDSQSGDLPSHDSTSHDSQSGDSQSVWASVAAPTHRHAPSAGDDSDERAIAIIGLAGRFPGADSAAALWANLLAGHDAIREVPRERFDIDAWYDPRPGTPGKTYCRVGGWLPDIDCFDAAFFGISRREAASMAPQQRLFLEVVWHALEHAGYPGRRASAQRTGVFAGVIPSEHATIELLRQGAAFDQAIEPTMPTGEAVSVIANRVSYALDLGGPSLAVDTACSSSLVATHLACQSLLLGECELAIAGGINVGIHARRFVAFSQARMFSPTGRCRSFDDRADGYVCGEGVGALVLKPLAAARRDGDRILAVILGSAVNQDGATNGLTAPSSLAQERLLQAAYARAAVSPREVSYVEAHGTGTALGDPIELAALSAVFRAAGARPGACGLGSIKSNLGHLEGAAGLAGLIKLALALHHRRLPASLHFTRPNRHLDLIGSPFHLVDRTRPWTSEGPRVAGISGFGFGGTNCHMILREAPLSPAAPRRIAAGRPKLLTVSAASSASLERHAGALADMLAQGESDADLVDVCFTQTCRRAPLRHRLVAHGRTREQLLARLRAGEGRSVGARPRVALLFSGQGAQYPGMGAALRELHPAFADDLQRCAAAFEGTLEQPLEQLLFATDAARLGQTALTQPATFALEVCLARLWLRLGVEPVALLGHSVGELAAACVAGVMSLEHAARLVAARGRLMADAPGRGGMAAVLAGREQVESLLDARLELAALNSPSNTVVTGPLDALAEFGERARARGIRVVPLDVSHAFHSRLMDPVLAPFTALVERVPLHRPSIPIVSNVTGTWIDEELTRPSYWARQLRSCVAFAPGLDTLAARDIDVLIEVGPSDTLAKLAVATLGDRVLALASLRRGHDEADSLLASVGELWRRGVELRVEDLLDAGALVDLPPYPFEREVHRLEFTTAPATSRPATTQAEMILAQLRARDITLGQALVRLGRAGTTP